MTPNLVLSLQEGNKGDVFNGVRDRIRHGKGLIRQEGADYLTYSLLDAIVDHYFIILEELAEEIEVLEEELVDDPTPNTLQAIYHLKREIIFLHKSVWPLREVVSILTRGEARLFQATTLVYLRDVYDHIIQVIDLVETYRELITGMLDIYLSSTNNKMNAVMKILTVIATMFLPITFVTSLYGMNFKYMPELEWPWGYPAVLCLIVVISIAMLIYFRKKKWF